MKKCKCSTALCFWTAVGGTFLAIALLYAGMDIKQAYDHRVVLTLQVGDIVLHGSGYFVVESYQEVRADDQDGTWLIYANRIKRLLPDNDLYIENLHGSPIIGGNPSDIKVVGHIDESSIPMDSN